MGERLQKYVVEGLAMPYDKETRDALQAYYETHDFTGNIPAIDDKKYARTTKEIADALGYKTHSAVTKRLQAVRGQFEMYIKEQG